MRTLMIERGGTAPDELRDIVERGSTELVQPIATSAADVDRVVIWEAKGSERTLTPQGALRWPDSAEVFVITPDTRELAADSRSTVLAWPEDADRLRMAFMTGA